MLYVTHLDLVRSNTEGNRHGTIEGRAMSVPREPRFPM